MPLRSITLLTFLVLSLPACFIRPFYGILLWTILAFANPQSYVWGVRDIAWAQMVAAPTIAGMLLFCPGWTSRLSSREYILTVALGVWFTITTFVSTHTALFIPHAPETMYRWQLVSKILLMTLVTMLIVRSFEQLRILAIVIAGCFGFFVIKSIPSLVLGGGNFRMYGPPQSMIADNNEFGLALNMTLPLFFFLAQCESNPRVRRLFWGLTFLTPPVVFFTNSRGALIGLVVLMLMILVRSRIRMALIPAVLVGTCVLPCSSRRTSGSRE